MHLFGTVRKARGGKPRITERIYVSAPIAADVFVITKGAKVPVARGSLIAKLRFAFLPSAASRRLEPRLDRGGATVGGWEPIRLPANWSELGMAGPAEPAVEYLPNSIAADRVS
jgi:hypothetical protein